MNNSVWEKRRKRLFELIEIGSNYDAWCWGYDFFNTFTILLNLTVSIMYTFDNMEMKYGPLLLTLERLTVAFFAIDFLLRVFTAKYLSRCLGTAGSLEVPDFFFRNRGYAVIYSVLYAVFLPIRCGRIPYAANHPYFPAVPHQCLLRFTECHYGSHCR